MANVKPLVRTAQIGFKVAPETKRKLAALVKLLPWWGPTPTMSVRVEDLIRETYKNLLATPRVSYLPSIDKFVTIGFKHDGKMRMHKKNSKRGVIVRTLSREKT